MKHINGFNFLPFVVFILYAGLSFAGSGATLESLQSGFVNKITAGLGKYDLNIIADKKVDKKLYLKKSLPDLYIPGNEVAEYKEIFIRPKGESGYYHLGIVSLKYSTCDGAKKIFLKIKEQAKSKYFQNSKILIKYSIMHSDSSVFILYSETFMDSKVNEYIASVSH